MQLQQLIVVVDCSMQLNHRVSALSVHTRRALLHPGLRFTHMQLIAVVVTHTMCAVASRATLNGFSNSYSQLRGRYFCVHGMNVFHIRTGSWQQWHPSLAEATEESRCIARPVRVGCYLVVIHLFTLDCMQSATK